MKKLTYIFLILVCASCASRKNTSGTEDKVSSIADNRLKAYFIEANKQKIIGNSEEAIALYIKVLEADPNNAATHYELSGLYDTQGMFTKAISHSEKAVQIDSENHWYNVQLAFLYQKHRFYKKAAEAFEKLVLDKPKNAEYYYHQASALIYSNEFEKAIRVYDKLEEVSGLNEEIALRKYSLYLELNKKENALEEIDKLYQEFGDDPYYLGMIGEAYEKAGESQKALEIYQKISNLDPGNGQVQMSLYGYHSRKGEEDVAYKHLTKAFEASSLNIDEKMKVLLDYYSVTEMNKKYLSQAYSLAEIMIKVHPNDPKSYSIYSDFLYRDNKLEEARSNLRKAIAIDDSKYALWDQLLRIDIQLGDYQSLFTDSNEAIELFPMQPGLYLFNGISANTKKDYDQAISSLNAGKELVIDDDKLLLEFHQNLGEIYNKTKEYEKSDQNFDKVLELDPYNAYTLNNYSYYLSLRKDKLEKAAEMSKLSNEILPDQPSFLDTYGWILFVQEKYEEAAKYLYKAIESGGRSNGTILEHYGDALYKSGKIEEAVEYWEKAKEKGNASENIDQKIVEKQFIE